MKEKEDSLIKEIDGWDDKIEERFNNNQISKEDYEKYKHASDGLKTLILKGDK